MPKCGRVSISVSCYVPSYLYFPKEIQKHFYIDLFKSIHKKSWYFWQISQFKRKKKPNVDAKSMPALHLEVRQKMTPITQNHCSHIQLPSQNPSPVSPLPSSSSSTTVQSTITFYHTDYGTFPHCLSVPFVRPCNFTQDSKQLFKT